MSRKTGTVSGLMDYMFKKPGLEKQLIYQTRNQSLEPVTIKHLLKGHKINDWMQEFEANQEGRQFARKDMVLFYHDVISFSPKDTEAITDDILNDISRQYIRKRSPNAPAVATIHRDAAHLHIHFCIAGCQFKTGLANRLSKADFTKVKQEMEAYQQEKYPQLQHSIVQHGRDRSQGWEREDQFSQGSLKLSKRATIKAQLETVLAQVSTYDELLTALEEAGMPVYSRGGKVYGVTVEDRNYRFSTLGFEAQIQQLEDRQKLLDAFEKIRQNQKQLKKDIDNGDAHLNVSLPGSDGNYHTQSDSMEDDHIDEVVEWETDIWEADNNMSNTPSDTPQNPQEQEAPVKDNSPVDKPVETANQPPAQASAAPPPIRPTNE